MLRDPLFITSLFGTKAFNINSAFSPRVMKANVKSYPGGWVWPIRGGAPHERSTFFRLQVYERVGEFVISVGKKGSKGVRKRSGFVIYLHLKTVHLRQLKGVQSSKPGM